MACADSCRGATATGRLPVDLGSIQKDAIVLGLEPLHAVLLRQPVVEADLTPLELLVLNAKAWPREVDVEVHAVDARAGVVLNTQIDVFVDAEAEATVLGEVLLPQFVLLDLQALFQDFFCLLATDGHVACDLLIS